MPEQQQVRRRDHKFHVGQAVEFFPNRAFNHKVRGRYTIVRLFPMDDNNPQYRIKHTTDGHERMVHENELNSP